jgi:hypothetical protein
MVKALQTEHEWHISWHNSYSSDSSLLVSGTYIHISQTGCNSETRNFKVVWLQAMLKKMEFHLRLLMFCSVRGASTAGAGAPSQPIFKVPEKHKTSSYIRNLEESPSQIIQHQTRWYWKYKKRHPELEDKSCCILECFLPPQTHPLVKVKQFSFVPEIVVAQAS